MTQTFADRIARAAPALAGMIFVAGLALVATLALMLMRFNDTLRRTQAENLAERVVALVENEFATIAQVQITLAATLAKAPFDDAASYGAWLDQMGLVQRYPSLRAIALAPRIDLADFASLQAKAASDASRGALGYPDFAVEPPGPRDTMFPAFFVYPVAGNERIVGVDLWADAERRAAAERAMAVGRPIGSAPIVLSQDSAAGTRSIFAVQPIVAEGKTIGMLPIGLSPGPLIVPLLEKQFPTARIAIHDRGPSTAPGDARTRLPLLTVEGSALSAQAVPAAQVSRAVEIMGRIWEIEIAHASELPPMQLYAPTAALTAGVGMLMLGLLLYASLARRQRNLEAAVVARTHELEKALAAAAYQAELAVDSGAAKDRFFANMSHELRTPLNAIVGFAEAMKLGIAGNLPPRAQSYVGAIVSSANWLKRVVDDVLEMSRRTAETETLALKPVALIDAVTEVASVLQASAEQRRVRLAFGDGLAAAPAVMADMTALGRVITNLSENAFKFSPAGETVTIDASSDAQTVTLCVADRGPGIAPAERQKVFLPFYQVANPVADAGNRGVGLGLAICQKLVASMGGSIEFADNAPHGTRALVVLRRGAKA
ncbi:MAG: CHASE domain-containing protein [Telmatospirillum sp.]|nr:CHASE domain-containing protein [Telmatospirillum sp.]